MVSFFRQIDGVAMGSPLGPLFANIFMGSVEHKLKADIETYCVRYYRYVDDTFALVRKDYDPSHLLEVLNGAHPQISFTHECESNKVLPFLDVEVQRRDDDSLCTKVYRKPTFSGVYLNFLALFLCLIKAVLFAPYIFVHCKFVRLNSSMMNFVKSMIF